MEATQTKIPAEAVDLYTRYVHGEVSRRDFFGGMGRFAVGGLTVTALVEALMPNYALGQQVRNDDERITASYETVPSPDGNGFIRGYLVRPFGADSRSETPDRLPGVLVIHENRGLNPHTEDVARRFALANFMAFAPDALTSVGGYPSDDFRGGQLFGEVDRAKMTADFVAAARWLKARPDCNGRIGSTGFCFGGGMSNNLAVLLGADLAAAAPFYGGAPPAADVPKISAAMLINHGALDTRLVEAYPEYEAAMQSAGITYEGHLYPDSVHGFFNDATPARYNKAAAEEAWTRTIAWFNQHVREGS
jgi:carboxymethylenebutenolidase